MDRTMKVIWNSSLEFFLAKSCSSIFNSQTYFWGLGNNKGFDAKTTLFKAFLIDNIHINSINEKIRNRKIWIQTFLRIDFTYLFLRIEIIILGGWWISWSPFVGMFVAKVSRGRSIKDFILYTLTLPCLYSFLWLTVFGGAAIRYENLARNAGLNLTMYNETAYNFSQVLSDEDLKR